MEFGKLRGDYGDYSDLVGVLLAEDRFDVFHNGSRLTPTVRLAAQPAAASDIYRHPRTGVELKPAGWTVRGVVPSSGGGEIVQLTDQVSGTPVMLWLKSDRVAAADIASRLRGQLQQKILQRLNFEGYRVRPESIQTHLIGGNQALSAVADFIDRGQPMTECMTWIVSEDTRTFFLSDIPASQLTDFKPRFDKLSATAVLPQAVAAR